MWVDLTGQWVDSLTMPVDFVPLLFGQKWVDVWCLQVCFWTTDPLTLSGPHHFSYVFALQMPSGATDSEDHDKLNYIAAVLASGKQTQGDKVMPPDS